MSKTTEEEFRNSPGLVEELARILREPTLLHALDVIRSSPSDLPPMATGIHFDVIMAREHAVTVGTNKAIAKLFRLSSPKTKDDGFQQDANREEWFDHVPAEMMEAIKKSTIAKL